MKILIAILFIITFSNAFDITKINLPRENIIESYKLYFAPDTLDFKTENDKLKYEFDMGNSLSGYAYAKNLYRSKDFKGALEILSKLILLGNPPESFTLLGNLFEFGLGTKQDCRKATLFYSGGITAGDCNGYLALEKMSFSGHCMKKPNKSISKKFRILYEKCIK